MRMEWKFTSFKIPSNNNENGMEIYLFSRFPQRKKKLNGNLPLSRFPQRKMKMEWKSTSFKIPSNNNKNGMEIYLFQDYMREKWEWNGKLPLSRFHQRKMRIEIYLRHDSIQLLVSEVLVYLPQDDLKNLQINVFNNDESILRGWRGWIYWDHPKCVAPDEPLPVCIK